MEALPDGISDRLEMIEVVNRQRRRRISAKQWRDFGERVLQMIPLTKRDATIVFTTNRAIKELNCRWRGQNCATDVLSFPSQAEAFEADRQALLGEVVISVERAAAQAKQNGLSFANEIGQLILHGLLHLCGYDHETDHGKMNRLELKLRKELGI